MKSKIAEEILSRITPEEHAKFERQIEEDMAFQEMLYEQGYRYNTDKSYSIKLLNDAGHFPIGITTMMCEETFIFKLEKEATKAWKSGVLGNGLGSVIFLGTGPIQLNQLESSLAYWSLIDICKCLLCGFFPL